MEKALFVYGTLMIPEVQEALLKRKPKTKNALLKGFSANCIIYGQYVTEYPFLKISPNEVVKGKIIYLASGIELDFLKYYEGSEFILSAIIAIVDRKEVEVSAFMLNEKSKIEFGPKWDCNNFIREHLDSYLNEIIPQLHKNYNM